MTNEEREFPTGTDYEVPSAPPPALTAEDAVRLFLAAQREQTDAIHRFIKGAELREQNMFREFAAREERLIKSFEEREDRLIARMENWANEAMKDRATLRRALDTADEALAASRATQLKVDRYLLSVGYDG